LPLTTTATTAEDRCGEKKQGASFAEFVHRFRPSPVIWRRVNDDSSTIEWIAWRARVGGTAPGKRPASDETERNRPERPVAEARQRVRHLSSMDSAAELVSA
jgi:hypothetical protein